MVLGIVVAAASAAASSCSRVRRTSSQSTLALLVLGRRSPPATKMMPAAIRRDHKTEPILYPSDGWLMKTTLPRARDCTKEKAKVFVVVRHREKIELREVSILHPVRDVSMISVRASPQCTDVLSLGCSEAGRRFLRICSSSSSNPKLAFGTSWRMPRSHARLTSFCSADAPVVTM